MVRLDVSLPAALLTWLRMSPHEAASEMRVAAAIHWYQQSALSMSCAAETAGMNRADFLAELARRRVDVFVVDEAELAREFGEP